MIWPLVLLCKDTVVSQLSPSSDGLVSMAMICLLVLLCKDAAVAKFSPSAADLVGHHGYLKCLLVSLCKDAAIAQLLPGAAILVTKATWNVRKDTTVVQLFPLRCWLGHHSYFKCLLVPLCKDVFVISVFLLLLPAWSQWHVIPLVPKQGFPLWPSLHLIWASPSLLLRTTPLISTFSGC